MILPLLPTAHNMNLNPLAINLLLDQELIPREVMLLQERICRDDFVGILGSSFGGDVGEDGRESGVAAVGEHGGEDLTWFDLTFLLHLISTSVNDRQEGRTSVSTR
jgi:hypothetical protein